MKKYIISLMVLLGVLVLFIIHYRTPFFERDCGGWSIGYGESNVYPENIDVKKNQIYSIEKLKNHNDSTFFLADPFFIKEKDTFYLFFEHQKKDSNADVGLMTSVDGKNYQYRGTVLNEKFHLSYPQVFKYRADFYMIPESKQANAVLLYKAKRFPFDWKICDTLLKNVKLKDPSIYLSDSLNIMVASDDKLNMYVYQADSLFGKWKLHKKPIALMGTEARPGGRFFADEKGLILPVQNCTHGYGYGLSLYRFSFKGDTYSVKRSIPFFLKKNKEIKEFNAGMHQFDIQKIGNNRYYYVYDGNRLNSDSKKINLYGPLKWTYIDIKNWILN